MTAVDVDALDKLREAATAGEWEALPDLVDLGDEVGHAIVTEPGYTEMPVVATDFGVVRSADAALIVAAVNALPELIAEVRRGRALREAVEGLAETWERRARAYGEHDDRDKVTELRQRATALRAVVAAVDAP